MFKISLTNPGSILITSLFALLTLSCKNNPGPTTSTQEGLDGFVLEPIAGSSIQYAKLVTTDGTLLREGYVLEGKKTGQWIEYSPEGDITSIQHYVNDLLEGPSIRMSFRNQVDLRQRYRQNQLHGDWVMYKYGKVIEERYYEHDKLEGTARTYDDRTFKLKQEVQYKNGLQHGYFKYYDENGKLTLEYEYKNGEKVSGGIIE